MRKIIKKCLYCKKEFLSWIYTNQKFCSRKCRDIDQKGKHNSPETEIKKGQHISPKTEFKKGHKLTPKGKNNHKWKGGIIKDNFGYTLIYMPEHPFSNIGGYIKRSRLIMEQKLKRLLKKEEIVHHINSIKDDDRPENLQLLPNKSIHGKIHKPKGNPVAKRW